MHGLSRLGLHSLRAWHGCPLLEQQILVHFVFSVRNLDLNNTRRRLHLAFAHQLSLVPFAQRINLFPLFAENTKKKYSICLGHLA